MRADTSQRRTDKQESAGSDKQTTQNKTFHNILTFLDGAFFWRENGCKKKGRDAWGTEVDETVGLCSVLNGIFISDETNEHRKNII